MTKIKVMSENLSNKIAAGEVIERTSSVVKELVENSIDAGSSEIKINLLEGGIKEIIVSDNGFGMDSDDALLCFSPHATSKIKKDEDLFFINSLGFRGEALPSIASVSNVTLKTSTGDVGTTIEIKGGTIIRNEKSDARRGTTITVKSLFYNTPARLKFLKSESSELSNTVQLIEKMALSFSNISFTLTNDERSIIKTSGSGSLHKTIHEIYGKNISGSMIEIKAVSDDYIIKGFVSKPDVQKTNRNHFITFVNDRLIKNIDINRAINDAYYTYKPHDRYPVIVLKIEVDPTLMDVNIHPTKQDIKLSKMRELCTLINEEITNALQRTFLIPTLINEEVVVKSEVIPKYEPFIYEKKIIEESYNVIDNDYIQFDKPVEEDVIKEEVVIVQKGLNFGHSQDVIREDDIKSFKLYPIGLVHGTYIIAQNDEGMFLIDQHAAAERVKYESLMEALKKREVHIKEMMIPITIEFLGSDYIKFQTKENHLKKLGFSFEEFGINTIKITRHPGYLSIGYEEESIRKIVDLIINMEKDFDPIKFQEKLAIMLSCKMSIKGNSKSSILEQEYFLDELVKCENPYCCPHGRPTIIKYSKYELEKLFKRVM